MASRTQRDRFDRAMSRLLGEVPADDRTEGAIYGDDLADEERERIEEFVRAMDPADPRVPTAEEKSDSTRTRYIENLLRVAAETPLVGADADDLNHVAADLSDEGLAQATVRQAQMALRTFFDFHEDLGVEPERINTFSASAPSFDDRDMLTRDEIAAVESVLDHPRDLAIFHLLLYTGQRSGSLRTLRVKDVDPNDGSTGRWHFNAGADGLKGVHKPRARRPLFGAQSAVRDWLKYHPTGEPDHYLITAKPRYNKTDPSQPVTGELFRRLLGNVKAETGIEKPMHPHMMRHNAVTIWKRDYDVPDDTIKFYLGHSPRSNIMETTYSHLSSADHARRGEEAMGFLDDVEEDQDRLGRDSCPVCGHELRDDERTCGRCGNSITPGGPDLTDFVDLLETADGDHVVRVQMANGEEMGVLVERGDETAYREDSRHDGD